MKTENAILGFHFLCFATTLSLLGYCAYRYIQNKSTSLVDFQTYHENIEKDIYPTFSLCFMGEEIYSKEMLWKKYAIEDLKDYTKYLLGDLWESRMLKVDFDEITMDLMAHVQNVNFETSRREENVFKGINHPTQKKNGTKNRFPFYISYRNDKTKCYSMDLTKENIPGIAGEILHGVTVELKNIQLLSGVGPTYFLHYPRQLFRSAPLAWGGLGDLAYKEFFINSMDVIRRRPTFYSHCHKDWKRDDELILYELIKTMNCKPPHWKFPYLEDFNDCNNTEKMKEAQIPEVDVVDVDFLKRFPQPCDQVQTVTFNVKDIPRNLTNDKQELRAELYIQFNSPNYKEIRHIRALDFESLIGNMGGYVGLFLGFAVWQVPYGIQILSNKLKEIKMVIHKK